MSEQLDALREAFEADGYDVADVSDNRGQVRVALLEERPEADALREVLYGVVDEADVLGPNITTETTDGADGVRTVVTFRRRD
ncbi:hypothetical protein [Natronomonas gomsonensis]|uniref:hypothetical protein n=1 Tax=Natronomonas gomsonensis TaxID=1046043 RepID=UPI0015BF2D04|nr:hypothetical protein [Natronomonas gomsonensis]